MMQMFIDVFKLQCQWYKYISVLVSIYRCWLSANFSCFICVSNLLIHCPLGNCHQIYKLRSWIQNEGSGACTRQYVEETVAVSGVFHWVGYIFQERLKVSEVLLIWLFHLGYFYSIKSIKVNGHAFR